MESFRLFGIKNRYIVLACLILGVVAWIFYPPVLPHIQVAAEKYPGGPLFTSMLIADLIIIIIALVVRRAAMSGELVPKGFSGAIEAIIEAIYNLTESTAPGKWARKIFPFFATLFLLILIVNWTELIPGVDTVGFLEHTEHEGNPIEQVIPGVYTLVKGGENAVEGEHGGFTLIPFVRTLSTDLNFTLALALISVVMTQVFGVQALGIGYFSKYINVRGFALNPVFGGIDFFVGLLE
jgi:F-type H+-transporting ATPase subunit a